MTFTELLQTVLYLLCDPERMGTYVPVGLQNAADVARMAICSRSAARKMSARDDQYSVESLVVERLSTSKVSKDELVRFVESRV